MFKIFWWVWLFLFTWYFLFQKIACSDLWWHMAAGRYIFENGVYPPPDFFSYTPVVVANSQTWLGDVVLYLTYYVGGEIGLHIFKFLMLLCPVFLMLEFSGRKYNSWTLLASVVLIVGTIQMHYIRNSIYAMFFMSLILWIWKDKRLIILYPLILWVWSMFHGYWMVGAVVILLMILGESIDWTLKTFSE